MLPAARPIQSERRMEKLIYWISRIIILPAIKRFFTGQIEGLEKLPKAGPYILAANHSSFMDHFLLANMVYRHCGKKIYFLTRKESFENYLSSKWHKATGCIPINRAHPEISAFREMISLLKKGEIVVIYPEGTRSLDGRLLPPKPGVVKLGLRAGVPIVPVGMIGAHRILPKEKWLPRLVRADIRIGETFSVDHISRSAGKEEIERVSHQLMKKIAGLCGQEWTFAPPLVPQAAERGAPQPALCSETVEV